MPFHIAATVRQALDEGWPVVALESTVISHGLPYPKNLEVAQGMEEVIRAEGAVPAPVPLCRRARLRGCPTAYGIRTRHGQPPCL